MARTVIADTNVVGHLVLTDLVHFLPHLTDHEFVVPDAVAAEIGQREPRSSADTAINGTILRSVRLEDVAAMADRSELGRQMGSAEATCLALATLHPTWLLASDERRLFRRMAIERLGEHRIVTTPRIIRWLVEAGALSIEAADDAKAKLETRGFRMAFGSFRDVVEPGGR